MTELRAEAMMEFRWKIVSPHKDPEDNMVMGRHIMVLQYRVATNLEKTGLQSSMWSEWRDVPAVKEEDEIS